MSYWWRASNGGQDTQSYEELLASELAKLPKPVFDLFYAVKESLDYDSSSDQRKPEKLLESYRRVTPQLLADFAREFKVVSYRVLGTDYELVVCRKSDPTERYRAMRMEKSVWRAGRWESLGGYYYF